MKIIPTILILLPLTISASQEPVVATNKCTELFALKQPPPSYPVMATGEVVSGEVEISFVVNSQGLTENLTVTAFSSSNNSKEWEKAFALQAMRAVKAWLYSPPGESCTTSATLSFEPQN